MPDEKRNKKFFAPATHAEDKAFRAACRKVNFKPADIIRNLALSFTSHVKTTGGITIPIKFSDDKKPDE